MNIHAVVPAAGSGTRMGDGMPKQYLDLAGRPLLQWSIEALLASPRIRSCVVALSADDERGPQLDLFGDPRLKRCVGGDSRAASVAAGLAALDAAADDWVLVHDAARPCLPPDAVETLISRVIDSGVGGLLAQPQSDTLKRADSDGKVVETLAREGLWRAQTPQMFRHGELSEALADALARGVTVTDEAQAMELAGHTVQVVPGPACNLKVTYPGDLAIAASWLSARNPQHAGAEAAGAER